ncbi:MAG: hypothetical protein ACREOJ_16160 [Gemmatimonadaceae bacterium]
MQIHPFSVRAGLPLAVLLALCACSSSSTAPQPVILGSTPAWLDGNTVTIDYTANFACKTPPSASSASQCEIGAGAESMPASTVQPIPTLFVMAPLGFAPDAATLHCPTVGMCVTHPADLDVSRVFGPGTEHFALPPHSHILDTAAGNASVPWIITVVGVKDSSTWASVVAGKSLSTVRGLQSADPDGTHITGDIPTNLFLFFKVR